MWPIRYFLRTYGKRCIQDDQVGSTVIYSVWRLRVCHLMELWAQLAKDQKSIGQGPFVCHGVQKTFLWRTCRTCMGGPPRDLGSCHFLAWCWSLSLVSWRQEDTQDSGGCEADSLRTWGPFGGGAERVWTHSNVTHVDSHKVLYSVEHVCVLYWMVNEWMVFGEVPWTTLLIVRLHIDFNKVYDSVEVFISVESAEFSFFKLSRNWCV